MFSIVLTIHILLCIVLIGFVLIQQGKGADAGAIMGGGTDSLLGAGSAGNALTKLTTALAIGFMITSILLVKAYNSRMYISSDGTARDVLQGSVMEPVAQEEAEAAAPAAEGADVEAAPAAVTDETAPKVDDTAAEKTEEAGTVAEQVPANEDAPEAKEEPKAAENN